MSIRKHLNGYTVPTAVVAVIVAFALAGMTSCNSRVSALEVSDAQERAWREGHERWAGARNAALERIEASTSQMEKDVLIIKVRQEEILRLLKAREEP